MSKPNKQLSCNDQLDDELVSSGDSIVLSPCKELRRRFTCKEKEKQKMSEYAFDKGESDWSESDSGKSKKEPPRKRSNLVEVRESAN